ncbi:hypothetical protein C0991_011723 [Blastosporella zonata]|nr:hypothetical protein C0991_011723 [Blastosporella zonata]
MGANPFTQSPGYPQDSKGWYAEHRIHAQAIPRSASVMPERRMVCSQPYTIYTCFMALTDIQNAWNPKNGIDSGNGLPPDYGARRAATPGPTDLYQSPQQRHSSKFREAQYDGPGNPPYASASGSDPWPGMPPVRGQVPPYYSELSLEQLHAPPYLAESSGYHVTDRHTPVAGQLSSSSDFLYVDASTQEDYIIHCPHTWCTSTFTRSNDLARHLTTALTHKEPAPVDPSKVCRMCGEEFSRSDARNRHELKRSCRRKRTRGSRAS